MKAETRHRLLEALATLAGIPHAEMGPSVCAMLGKHLKIIMESTPNVTIEEMRKRYTRMRKNWGSHITITHKAFSHHWAEFADKKPVLIIDNPTEEIPPNWLGFMVEKNIAWEIANDGYNGPAGYAIVSNQFKFCPEAWKRECREAWAQRGGNVVPFKENSA